MDTSIITDYITSILQTGILIFVICFVCGQVIKMSFLDFIPNKYIPAICMIIGGILAPVTYSFSGEPIVTQIIKGAILGFAATGMYEMVRNMKNQ